jgi:class 3 adenylate cyclase
MTAATACRTRGTEPREGARFCDGCGAPVTAHDTRAEYKQVTVLFTDVVHSMDLAAAVGAERLREIMADVADRCAANGRATIAACVGLSRPSADRVPDGDGHATRASADGYRDNRRPNRSIANRSAGPPLTS